jgi:hypothetical protein
MAIACVTSWLENGRPYDQGVILYQEYGKNFILKSLFATGYSNFNSQKLTEELRLINDQTIADPAPSTLYVKSLKTEVFEKINHAALPEDLQKENILKGELYRQAGKLKKQLEFMKSPEARSTAIKAILANFEQIDKIWAKLDYFQQTGKKMREPEIFEEKIESHAFLLKRRNNLRTYITKIKKEISDMDPQDPQTVKKIDKHNSYLNELLQVEALLEGKE